MMYTTMIDKIWYGNSLWRWLLWPLSWVFLTIVSIRKLFIITFLQKNLDIPIIVVGNLTVGGVGKTPLVIAMVKAFQEKGLRVGVVSRGYGAHIKQFPFEVNSNATAFEVGDEPLLIAQKANCPVVIAPKRIEAVKYLKEKHDVQLIISDDGLQHYAMKRDVEVVVIDGIRGLGNGMSLPAGPLREHPSRLQSVDFLVVNEGEWPSAYLMSCLPGQAVQIATGNTLPVSELNKPIALVAGIGNPGRFFKTLSDMGIAFHPYVFPDHHSFKASDLRLKEKTVLMTEKDAVKCRDFTEEHWYFLPIEVKLSPFFWESLYSHKQLRGLF